MNISKKMKYALIGAATFVVSAVAFGYMAIPTDRPNPLVREQLVGPFDLENMEAERVLQVVVDSAPRALKIRICKDLAKQRITIRISQPQTGQVLGDVAVQLRTGIGNELQPHFRCRRFLDSAVVIEKRMP
jgi:hypothetical protein